MVLLVFQQNGYFGDAETVGHQMDFTHRKVLVGYPQFEHELATDIQLLGSEVHFALEGMQMFDQAHIDLVQARIGLALVAVVDYGISDVVKCYSGHAESPLGVLCWADDTQPSPFGLRRS